MANESNQSPVLVLVDEKKILELLDIKKQGKENLEASGVIYQAGYFYVVFDNRSFIARIRSDPLGIESSILSRKIRKVGYEGITYNSRDDVFYTVIESRRQKKHKFYAVVHEYSPQFELLNESLLDFEFSNNIKGFEGLSYVYKEGWSYLLALCEGNRCSDGDEGEKPGQGRIQVFRQDHGNWSFVQTIILPETLPFVDLSGFDIFDGKIAMISQKSSLLWIAELEVDDWTVSEGSIYQFPRNKKGKLIYCNVEGVSWIAPETFVVVSDAKKKNQPGRCGSQDQSLHVFRLPH
jgi:hypothetical protein